MIPLRIVLFTIASSILTHLTNLYVYVRKCNGSWIDSERVQPGLEGTNESRVRIPKNPLRLHVVHPTGEVGDRVRISRLERYPNGWPRE